LSCDKPTAAHFPTRTFCAYFFAKSAGKNRVAKSPPRAQLYLLFAPLLRCDRRQFHDYLFHFCLVI
jgi:hypothetical protein